MTFYDTPVTELGKLFTQRAWETITDEEGDLLYSLTRMTKPTACLETGAGSGTSTKRIGEALRDNGFGRLLTCDVDEDKVEAVKKIVEGLPVSISCVTGLKLLASTFPEKFGLVFVDAGDPSNRAKEIRVLTDSDRVMPGGLLIVHDTLNSTHGDYRPLVKCVEDYGWGGMAFESLAGIAVFRRPR